MGFSRKGQDLARGSDDLDRTIKYDGMFVKRWRQYGWSSIFGSWRRWRAIERILVQGIFPSWLLADEVSIIPVFLNNRQHRRNVP